MKYQREQHPEAVAVQIEGRTFGWLRSRFVRGAPWPIEGLLPCGRARCAACSKKLNMEETDGYRPPGR